MITCLVTNEKIKSLSQEAGLPIEVVKTKILTWRNQDSKRTEYDYPSVEWIKDLFELEYNQETQSIEQQGIAESNTYFEAVPDVNNRRKDTFLQSLKQSLKVYINENKAKAENKRTRDAIIGHLKRGKYGELIEFLDKKGSLNDINFQLESVDILRISDGRGGYIYTGPFVLVLKSGERRIYRASYDAESKTVKINTNALYGDGSADMVLLHEILHHVTVSLIQHKLEFRNAINEIIDAYAKVYPVKAQEYYTEHGLEEFIADVWTDTSLMEDLSNIKATKKVTLLDKLRNILKKIYTRLFSKNNTLLEQASALTLDIINNPVLLNGEGTFYENLNESQPQQVTYEYGGLRRTYTIRGSHIFNDKGLEVFKEGAINEGSDRIKIFANLAVKQGRAVIVEHKGNLYVVNKDNKIVSVRTGKLMQWGEENGDRKNIIGLALDKFRELDSARDTSIQYRSTDDLLQRELERDAFRFERLELEQLDTNNNILGPETTINIYAGTGENADLSNFAERPVMEKSPLTGEYVTYRTVEGAFQAAKLGYTELSAKEMADIETKLMTATGTQARSIGRTIKGLNIKEWDLNSSRIMRELIYDSFVQNPQTIQRLLDTGNAILTHTQDKGKWGTEFPRILMEVRDELRSWQYNREFNNAENNANDVERFANIQESEQTISSEKTILSNKELVYWNSQGVGKMPRILSASERTDPAFHVKEILDILNGKRTVKEWGIIGGLRQVVGEVSGKDFAGLYLITKHDGLPMLELLKTKIPKLIHFSITTLGGSIYEPGVMKYNDLLDKIQDYIKQGLDPDSVTIRIDPIVPGVTKFEDIETVINRASQMGIKRIRFSIMDAYPNTKIAMSKLGYDFDKYYGDRFFAKDLYINEIADFMVSMGKKYNITLGTCAESLVRKGISKEGCLSVSAVNQMLGTSIEDKGTGNNESRKLCSCYGGKIDALQYNNACASHCIYCYAKHENEKALEYYNEDGTLKDNKFTQTRIQQISKPEQPKQKRTVSSGKGAILLTLEQLDAVNDTLEFIEKKLGGESTDGKNYITIQGKAGTGKTTIIRNIIKELKSKHPGMKIAVSALSRKAVNLLHNKVKDFGVKKESLYTLAGANYGVSEDEFAINPNKQRFKNYDLIFVDEASMVAPKILEQMDSVKNTIIVFLGDYGQLRPIDKDKGLSSKSKVFSREDILTATLTERIRQGENSPILSYADKFWEIATGKSNSSINSVSAEKTVVTPNGALLFNTDNLKVRERIIEAFRYGVEHENPNYIKIIAPFREQVDEFNNLIHQALFPNNPNELCKGELIIFDSPYAIPNTKASIDNAEEGVILDVSSVLKSEEPNGDSLNYISYAIKLSDGTVLAVNVIADKQSMDKHNKYLDELRRKAISTQNSSDWSEYYALKNKYAQISMSYAITTHKALGSTYDIAVYEKEQIKTKGNAWRNQGKAENIYTGLTRSRNITMVLEEGSDNAFGGSLVELSTNIDQSKGISGFDDDLQTINNEEVVEESNESNISNYILLSGGAYGADTYWDLIGREFGLTNAIHFTPNNTDVRSSTLRQKGIKGIEVNELNLKRGAEFINRILGENIDYRTVAGELIARDFWLTVNSDSIFAIGTFFDDNRTAVTGGTNYAVQLGIRMTDKQRDVFVFDIPTEHWYQYDRIIGKFIECDTPTLTQKFAGVGTRDIQKYPKYNKNRQIVDNPQYVGDAKALVAMLAIRDVYEKTFGKTKEMIINEQTTALNQEGIPTGMEIKDSEDTVFYTTFGNNLKARVNALVRDFQNHTEYLRKEKRKELVLENHLPETTEERKKKINRLIKKLKNLDTPLSTVVNIIGIDNILESVKKGYQERIKNAKTDYAANENQKIVDNFDRLVEEAVFTFELILDIKLESKGKEKQVSNILTEELETNQEGETSAGYNEITGFNVKQANPYRTTSTIVLNIIKNIKDMKADNTPNQDDLGNELYLDPRYVHTVLKFIMSDCIEPEDFNVQTSTGDWRFPILDKYTSKYKWLVGIKKTLQKNHSYANAFYADLRNDYFQELTLITQSIELPDGSFINVQKMMPMSKKTELLAAMDELLMNINKHVLLITNPDIQMWDSSGNISREHLSKILDRISDVTKNLQSYMEEEGNNSVYNKLALILKAIGFNTNRQSLLSALEVLKEDNDTVETNILLLLENIKSIVGDLNGRESLKDLDIFSLYNSWYSQIANLIGYVSEFNYSSSVRMKDGTALQCFSKPSHYSTTIKKLKNKRRNKEWLQRWARDRKMVYLDSNGEHFYFSWLDLLNDSEGTREELMQQLEHAHMATMLDNNGEVLDYKSWTDDMLYRGFIHMYYSIPQTSGMRYLYAWYNSPILADSPAAIFFKFIKYDDREGLFEDKMIPLFRNIVKYELNRIEYVRRQDENGGKQILNYSKKGLEFQFFPEFNNAIFSINQGTPEETLITLIQGLKSIEESNMSSYEKEQAKNALIDRGINLILDTYVSRFISDIRDTVKQDIKRDLVLEKVLTEQEVENNDMFERKLKEFYWNNLLAEMNIIHMMGVDPAFYKNPGDFQKRWKEIYASGTKLNTVGLNNTQLAIYLKDDVFRSRVYNHIRFICEKGVKEGKLTEIDKQVILGTFKKVNNSDALALRSISSYKKILDLLGRWTEDLEETYQHIISGSWDKQDFYTVYQTIKPFLYTIVDETDSEGNIHHVPHQNKDSEFVLMAMFTKFAGETKDSPKLLGMSRFLETSGIDTLIFESGVKAGCSNPIDLNYSRIKVTKALLEGKVVTPLGEYAFTPVSTGSKEETDFDRILKYFYSQNDKASNFQDMPYSQEEINAIYDALQMDLDEVYDTLVRESGMIKSNTGNGYDFNYDVVKVLPTEGYCIVSPTPESLFDKDETDGSLYRNVTIADLNDNFRMEINGLVFAKKPNTETGEKDIKKVYNALYVENFLDDYYDVKSIIDVSDEKSLKNFVDKMLEITKGNEKYNRAFREALQLIKDRNGKTVTRLPFCAPQMYKSQELIFSFIKNGLLKQKLTGGASILVSDIGLTDELQVVYEYTDGSGKTISYKEAKKLGIDNSSIRLKYIECYMPFYMRSAYRDYIIERYVERFDEQLNKVITEKYEELDIERMLKECPELLEAIGYRIPTEDKYSIAPLRIKGFLPVQNGSAIMLASDITALAGCDFDVDKMFLIFRERKKIKDENGKVKYRAVKYDPSLKPEELNREQRNNFLFDLKWGILTNNETIHIFLNPGNFDVLKKYSKAAYILTHNDIIRSILKNERTYKDKEGKETKFTDALIDACTDEVVLEIKKMFYSNNTKGLSLDDIENYISKYELKRNVASIDTFVYNYVLNMTGKALIGSYANGSSQHQKLLESGLRLNRTKKTLDGNYEKVNFFINGRAIDEIDRIDNGLGERITKVMANFQAGSVDNVKDPSLANLMQNLNTAGVTIFMVRAGFTIDEISLLVNIKPLRDMFLLDKSYNNIDSYILNLTKLFSELELSTIDYTSITTADLIRAILKPYDTNLNNDILGLKNTLNTLKCLLFFKEMTLFAKPISALSKIAKADSPTNASSTLALAQAKVYAVEDFKYKFLVNKNTGKPKRSIISGLGGMIENGASKDWTRNDLRRMILSSKVPMALAMHTLGTELPLLMISKHLFTLNNDEVREELSYLQYMSSSMLEDKQIEDFYRRLVLAVLVNTELFGDGYEMSYLEKRDYYLNIFPNKFKELLSSNKPFIKKLGVMQMMDVDLRGRIVLIKGGKTDPAVEDAYIRNFDELIEDKDNTEALQLAKDLLLYAYYYNGFAVDHSSYSLFLSTHFIEQFPEYIDVLRQLETITDREFMERFSLQYMYNNIDKFAKRVRPSQVKYLLSIQQYQYITEETDESEGLLKPEFISFTRKSNYDGSQYTIYLRHVEEDTYEDVTPIISILRTQMPIYNPNMSIDEINLYITNSKQTLKKQDGTIATDWFYWELDNNTEENSSVKQLLEGSEKAMENLPDSETLITINRGYKQLEQKKYDDNKSQLSLDKPLCDFANFADFD